MAGAQESCFPCFTPVPMTFSEARKYVSYLHERLDLSSNSIRLVRILPELSPMGQIQCRIWHDTTESEYRCLSYMWGSPEEYFIISLNGRGFAIRANLNFFPRRCSHSSYGGSVSGLMHCVLIKILCLKRTIKYSTWARSICELVPSLCGSGHEMRKSIWHSDS